MRLWYFLRSDTQQFDEMAIAWENAATNYVRQNWANNSLIEVTFLHKQIKIFKMNTGF